MSANKLEHQQAPQVHHDHDVLDETVDKAHAVMEKISEMAGELKDKASEKWKTIKQASIEKWEGVKEDASDMTVKAADELDSVIMTSVLNEPEETVVPKQSPVLQTAETKKFIDEKLREVEQKGM